MADAARRTAGGAELLRMVGLLADGPVRWGSPVRSSRPGVFLVELPTPLPHAVIDLSPIGAWIDRVPTLELDGRRPTGRELAARLHGFWLPDQVVLFVSSTDGAIGKRVDELLRTPLGDAVPYPGGRWLKTLRGLEAARVWWAETDAPEEYEDAVLAAFAGAVDPASVAHLHDPTVVVPFANTATPTGLPKEHGITGDLREAPPEPVARDRRRMVTLPPGNAVSSDRAMAPRGRATGGASRAAAGSGTAGSGPGAHSRSRTDTGMPREPAARARTPRALSAAANRQPEPTLVSAAGLRQLHDELEELVRVRRPEIIARVRAARELGDLSENADYEAARKEQSFAEGRIAQLEAMIKHAQIIEAPRAGDEVGLGSTVVVESPEGDESYTIVGSSEARPAEGRISNTSPLGQALLGRRLGDDVVVRAPVGDRHYRILEVRHR